MPLSLEQFLEAASRMSQYNLSARSAVVLAACFTKPQRNLDLRRMGNAEKMTMSGVLANLENLGLVERFPDETSGRCIKVRSTEEGRILMGRVLGDA